MNSVHNSASNRFDCRVFHLLYCLANIFFFKVDMNRTKYASLIDLYILTAENMVLSLTRENRVLRREMGILPTANMELPARIRDQFTALALPPELSTLGSLIRQNEPNTEVMPSRKRVLSRPESRKMEAELGLTLSDEEDLLDISTSPLPRKEEPKRVPIAETEIRRERQVQDEPYIRKATKPIRIGRTVEAQRSLKLFHEKPRDPTNGERK